MASSSSSTQDARIKSKASIYPKADADVVLVETPYEIEKHIATVRRTATQSYRDGYSYIQGWVSKWIGVEHAVESRVKSFKAPDESLTPGGLYVGIATLTGSILTRTRSLPIRFITPPLFLVVSAFQFLPKTSRNISDYGAELERRYAPSLADKHDIANAHARMTWDRIVEATHSARQSVEAGTLSAVDKAQATTGLKLREAVGATEKAVKDVKSSLESAAGDIADQVDKKKAELEKKDPPKRLV